MQQATDVTTIPPEEGRNTPRRGLLGALAALPVLGTAGAAAAGPGADAPLLVLLADIRAADEAYAAAVRANVDDVEDDPAQQAAHAAWEAAIARMAATPAATMLGVAAKATRLCESLHDGGGHSIAFAEVALAESLAADLARLVPEVAA